jgi:hypothetical protein
VKCVNGSADEIMNKAAAHKINLRKLDNDHVSEIVFVQGLYHALVSVINFSSPSTLSLFGVFIPENVYFS